VVWRRRYAGTRLLVRHNDWYELDELTDAIWCACDGGMTLAQITRRIAETCGLPLGEALAATVAAVLRFHELGLLDLEEPRAEAG
jgi:hypothetical protein